MDRSEPVGELKWLAFVNLTQARVLWEEGTPTEKMLPSDRPLSKFVGVSSTLMIEVGRTNPL